jgi:ERCC4-type nuclease
VVVDVREFMSGLPAVLHQQGFTLTPITLEVRRQHEACSAA